MQNTGISCFNIEYFFILFSFWDFSLLVKPMSTYEIGLFTNYNQNIYTGTDHLFSMINIIKKWNSSPYFLVPFATNIRLAVKYRFIRELLINIDLREHMIWAIDIKFSIKLRKETSYFSIYATYKNYTTFNQNPSHIFNQTMNKCSRGYNLENIKCSIKPE